MKKQIMPTVVLGTILVVVSLLLSVVNMVTGPVIEAQRNSAANEALLVVFPDGEGFEELDLSTLTLSETVTAAYRETTGKGYVFRVTATGYKPGMIIMIGIDSEGKIVGTQCLETQDTFGKEPEIDNKYNGQTLADFKPYMISGATLTSNGYRDAVNVALQSFVLVSGGKLDPSIELEGMIADLALGFYNPVAVEGTSGNIKKALKASNDTGFAYIMADGEDTVLVLVNTTGGCVVYDVEGKDVTAAHEAIAKEAVAHAKANGKSYDADLEAKAKEMMEGADGFKTLSVNTFNTVVSAASFTVEGNTYYAFMARPVGFEQMDIYLVLDENGAIAKMDAKEIIFLESDFIEYGGFEGLNRNEYKNSFEGITSADDVVAISGATKTNDAVKLATADVFAAFKTLKTK